VLKSTHVAECVSCLFSVSTASGAPGVNTSVRHVASLPFAACQVRHLDQLKYLAKVMGFEVTVTNIPKVSLAPGYFPLVYLTGRSLAFIFKPPPPVGAGRGYMFSGRPSVRQCVRASVRP